MIRPQGLPVAFGEAIDGDPRRDPVALLAVARELGTPQTWSWVRQVHGAVVVEAEGPGVGAEADGIFTRNPALAVAVSVADCLPVALLAPGAVGMAHAGWRGAATGVVAATIRAMRRAGHPPDRAVIGPGIGPCCFEVGPEVVAEFPAHAATTTWGTPSVDLPGVVLDQLAGLQVVGVPGCTHHDVSFHSYRRTGTDARQFGVAWIDRG